MTGIVVILQQAMTGPFGPEVYPVELPDAPEFPCILLTKVSAIDEQDFDGDTRFEQCRVQIDVYAEGYAATDTLAWLVRDFMVSRDPVPGPACVINSVRCISDRDLPAPEFRRAGPRPVRRRSMDFQIWTRRA